MSFRHKGATLVELLVSLTVATTALALLLGILLHTRREVSRGQARLTAQSCARALAREIEDVFESAIRPSALDAPASISPRFSSTRCDMLGGGRLSENGRLEWTTIESPPEGVSIRSTDLLSPTASDEVRAPGVGLDRFLTSVRFRYSLDSGSEIIWRDQLQPGEYPVSIETRATITDRENEEQTCEIVQITRLL